MTAGGRPLHAYAGGLLRPGRVRRILTLAGYAPTTGLPGAEGLVGVWGKSPLAWRGEKVAQETGAALLRIEDPFLRSVHPGRSGGEPMGLLIDRQGVHFDGAAPSDLEDLLARHPFDNHVLLEEAREAMARIAALDLSKYNDHDLTLPLPAPGYALVVDQVAGDASLPANAPALFREMLAYARIENPGARIVIKAHPETRAGHRAGHYGPADTDAATFLLSDPVSPRQLLEGAVAVYTVSSQLGFEAILAGHRPRVFGQPFYAGWGLSADENPPPRRRRVLTRTQLFAGSMVLYPTWYDPCRDELCDIARVIDQLEAEVRAFREDRRGHVGVGIRLWKRPHFQRLYGHERRMRFRDDPAGAVTLAARTGRDLMVWAGRETAELSGLAAAQGVTLRRVEDGFLRSRGLGAELVPPLSLISDDLGIYYDATRDSRMQHLIAAAPPPGGIARAERLIARLRAQGLTKYNLGGAALPDLPEGQRILVPGQVEDDASIRLGAGVVQTNAGLLATVRAANPDAVILYKPHPDVEAGLRPGVVPEAEALRHADRIIAGADMAALLETVEEVWTITSLTGFEALVRGLTVTTLGRPFYAGWGLTRDLDCPRRGTVTVAALVHAALIAAPRYRDPVSGLPCPVEVIVDRLASGTALPRAPALRLLARLQGIFASRAGLWRD